MSQSTSITSPPQGGIFLPSGGEILYSKPDDNACLWEENHRLSEQQQSFVDRAQAYLPDTAACILRLAEVEGSSIIPTEEVPRGIEERRVITINLDATLRLGAITWQIIDTILPQRISVVRELRLYWGLRAIFNSQGGLASTTMMDEGEVETTARFINNMVFDSGFAEKKVEEMVRKKNQLEDKLANLQRTGKFLDKDQTDAMDEGREVYGEMKKKLEKNISGQIERNKFMRTRLRLLDEG